MEKFGITNKTTSVQLQDTPTTKYALYGMTKLPSDVYDFQLQPYLVFNCDGVLFEPNGIQLHPVIYPEVMRKKNTSPMITTQMLPLKWCTTRKM